MNRPFVLRERWIPAVEVLLGTFVVLGHNVFRIVPNEVPILVALLFLSLRIREGRWSVPGLQRPKSWTGTVLIAILAASALQLGSELMVQPLAALIWPGPQHAPSVLTNSTFSVKLAIRNVAIVWIFAAFGEELSYRGYLVRRAAELGDCSVVAKVAAVTYVAVLFGFGHYYKGPAGVLDSTYSGLVLGSVYLFTSGNLWAAILTHGLSDSFAVLAVYLGWAT